jgi:hypothetical protein
MPNSKHLTHGISNLVSLITKTKLGLSTGQGRDWWAASWGTGSAKGTVEQYLQE